MLIDDRKKNLENANRVGLLYKIKFILYTLLTMCSVSILVIKCFGNFDFLKKSLVTAYAPCRNISPIP